MWKSFSRPVSIMEGNLRIFWRRFQNALGLKHPMLLVRRIFAVVLGLVPLLLVAVGVVIVLRKIQPTDPLLYAVHQTGEFTMAFTLVVVGCAGLIGCQRLWRADAGWKWTLVPIAGMLTGVAIPNLQYGHHGSPLNRAAFSTFQRLGTFAGSSVHLAREQGQFICDPSAELLGKSLFLRDGQPLPYVIQCIPNATGAALASPPERPGTLVFAVSPDRKQAWFAATILARETGRYATWLTQQGQPRVIALSLQAEK